MASNINPNNIDNAYPIAGQDNDSQGFRDNFTNIKTNFEYAEEEIDDLQSKVLLKSALTGTTLDNDLGGAVIENAKLQGTRFTKVDTANTAGNVSVDFSTGSYHRIGTVTGNVTLGFSNIPAAGNYAEWTVELTQGATQYTVTMPSAVSVGNAVIQGNDANNVITFNQAGTYALKFSTTNGGTTVGVEDLYRNTDPIYLPSAEDLGDGGAADLGKTTSYVETDASGETATLAAGVEGQIKIFAMTSDGGGDMVVTVTNAAWGTQFVMADVGDACTLLYVNSKWVCIGNNGCVFS